MKYILAPSILAADFKVLGEQMKQTADHGAEYLHFDVMDGIFVPSISFGMPVLESVHDATEQVILRRVKISEQQLRQSGHTGRKWECRSVRRRR